MRLFSLILIFCLASSITLAQSVQTHISVTSFGDTNSDENCFPSHQGYFELPIQFYAPKDITFISSLYSDVPEIVFKVTMNNNVQFISIVNFETNCELVQYQDHTDPCDEDYNCMTNLIINAKDLCQGKDEEFDVDEFEICLGTIIFDEEQAEYIFQEIGMNDSWISYLNTCISENENVSCLSESISICCNPFNPETDNDPHVNPNEILSSDNYEITIYDITGKKMFEGIEKSNYKNLNLPRGIYIVHKKNLNNSKLSIQKIYL